jgi:hypothetical protein
MYRVTKNVKVSCLFFLKAFTLRTPGRNGVSLSVIANPNPHHKKQERYILIKDKQLRLSETI